MEKTYNEIKTIPEIQKYFENSKLVYGKDDDPFTKFLNSPKQLQEVLYNKKYFGLKPVKETKTGYSTDEEVINIHAERDNNSFCQHQTKIRKLNKAKGTYIEMLANNINEDEKIHSVILLFGAETGRSSIIDPSLQTIPKHGDIIEDISWKLIREVFVPTFGNILGQVDYSGFELFVGAAISGDKKFISDVNTIDLHAKYGGLIFEIDEPLDVIKKQYPDERFHGKNSMVFASVYGAVPFSIAQNLRNVDLFIEFAKKKYKTIKTKLSFEDWFVSWSEEHITNIQNIFFGDYYGLKAFQEASIKKYYIDTFVELPFGFRRYYPLDRNKIINTPTQGCLQWISKVQTEHGWVKIKNLVGKVVNVWTGFNWAEATAVNMGKCQLAKIELSSGLIINCDTRHFLKNELNEWINFKDLKIGDYVALPKIDIENRVKPSENIDLAFILGYIIGDGNFSSGKTKYNKTRYTLTMYAGEKKKLILDDIFQYFISIGYKPKLYERLPTKNRKEVRYILAIYQNKIADLLFKTGMEVDTISKNKTIPQSIWVLDKQKQMNFLHGLLMSDGYRNKGGIHLNNYKLIKEIQLLAYGLNIDSYIQPTKTGYELILRQMPIKGFKFNGNSNRLYPFETIEFILKGKKYKSKQKDCIKIANKRAIDSQKDMRQITAERIIEEINPNFEVYRYDKISNIQILDKEEDTFTMIVDDPLHQFVADGAIHKNSAFLLLLDALVKVNRQMKEQKFKSKIILETHDDMTFDIIPEETKDLKTLVDDIVLNPPFEFMQGCNLKNEWTFGKNFRYMKEFDPNSHSLEKFIKEI